MRRLSHSQRGASLLEVLIAILLVSGAVAASTLLYLNALKYSQMAQSRGIASDLAMDIADRMRANTRVIYDYDVAYTDTPSVVTVPTCNPCTPEEIAAIDIAEMRNRVRLALPGGNLRIGADAGASNYVNIWIMWTDPDSNADDASMQCTGAGDNAGPSCIALRVAL